MPPIDGLELERPETFIRRERLFQRAGLAICVLVAVAGAAGVFGGGVASRAEITGPIAIRYERFGRMSSPTMMSITVDAPRDGAPARLRLNRAFLQQIQLLEVRPADALRRFDEEMALFEVEPVNGRGHLELYYQPSRFGILRPTVTADVGPAIDLWQLVYF